MAFPVTERARLESRESNLTPNIVVKFDGIDECYGAVVIKKFVRIGDPGLLIGGFNIGGFSEVEDQSAYISFSSGTSSTISQNLNVDKGKGESISSMRIALVDKNGEVTRDILAPGALVDDIIGRKAKVYLGFEDSAFPEDYIVIFRGQVTSTDSKPGLVTFSLNSPEDKKRSEIFIKGKTKLLSSTAGFLPADVNVSANTITEAAHNLGEGSPISFETTGSLPAGLQNGYVRNPTASTFQVSEDPEGAVFDITSQGSGSHSYIAGVGPSNTVINAIGTADFLVKVNGPDGTIDQGTGGGDSFKTYIRIDDEIIEYQSTSANQFQSVTRGALGTVASSHQSNVNIDSYYRIGPDNVIDLTLKLMFSGKGGNYLEDIETTNFVRISLTETQANTIYFKNDNLSFLYNVSLGDFISTSGASNGSNNVSLKEIIGISVDSGGGTILEIDGVSFVEENDTAALVSFRSQYDVWPEGAGLSMDADEVDVQEHLLIKQRFLSSPEMDFYLKDSIDGKEFLAEQLYNPVAAYSLPRKSQASVGYHSPPIPGTDIKLLNADNVKNASKLKISRSTTKNFFNTMITSFEEDSLEEKFLSAEVRVSTDSTDRIKIGTKPLEIEAKGLRDILSGLNIVQQASDRRLNKYEFGAEFLKGLELNFKTGWNLEVGDILVFDMGALKVSDIETGTRQGEQRLFQVDNKSLNLKNGQVVITIVDTNFNKDARFGLISPSSFVGPDATTTSFNLKPSFNTDRFGTNEGQKWTKYISALITVRNSDFSVQDTAVLEDVVGNQIILDSALSFTPSEDYIFELSKYTGQTDTVKLIFTFMSDTAFPDGGVQYAMI